MKKLAYIGADKDGLHLETGFRLPWGITVAVSDALHVELLTNRGSEFEDKEKAAKVTAHKEGD